MTCTISPKSILKRPCATTPGSSGGCCGRSVSFSSAPTVALADTYDRSPASPTTELSWSDIEELRRLSLESDAEAGEGSGECMDEATALMDLPALLAAAPTALLPLLPPITSISRPVPTLTLPAPRNRGASAAGAQGAGTSSSSLAPQKRPAPPPLSSHPSTRKRPLLAFLPLLPVGDAPSSSSAGSTPSAAAAASAPYFSARPGLQGKDGDSPMTDESASPVTPPDLRGVGVRNPLVGVGGLGAMGGVAAGAGEFEITFKRRMESDW